MSLNALPGVREMADAHGLLARKSLGQHFLFDLNVTRKIARLAGPLEGETVLEVGPGPGGLTRALLEAAETVIAVEMDPRCVPLLEALDAAADGALQVIQGDALKVDALKAFGGHPGVIVSNLPYNVGTALLTGWLTAEPVPARSLTLMFQKEVAERVVAEPGGKAYGRLAVLAQSRARARLVMKVPPQAFTPPPKVDSAVVRLDMLDDEARFMDVAALETVTKAAFAQRRKMLRKSLTALGNADALLAEAGLDPQARPETLTITEFQTLAKVWRAMR